MSIRVTPCDVCGVEIVNAHRLTRHCTRCRDGIVAARKLRGQRIRREHLVRVAERDAFTCQLCAGPVDLATPWPAADYATLDHKVPMVDGGTDDPENLQLAHWGCNVRKGDRVLAGAA